MYVVNKRNNQYDVYIGRGSIFGNPYTHYPLKDTMAQYKVKTREESIEKFRVYFYNRLKIDDDFRLEVLELKGKVLGCYCKPKACHGDIIVEYLNEVDNTE